MANFATLSSITLTAVGAVSLALGVMMWLASARIGQPRLRFVAAGFFVLLFKSLIIILTIHSLNWDHEAVQTFDSLMDLLALVLVASPFFMRSA